MSGCRKMCFTQWLPEDFSTEQVLEKFHLACHTFQADPGVQYVLLCAETGGETGKPHIQGYVYFEKPCMFSRVKKLFDDNTVHCEEAYGSAEESRDYLGHTGKHAEKSGQLLAPLFEFGVAPKGRGRPKGVEGADGQYDAVVQGILSGLSDHELMQAYPALYVRFYLNIQRLREHCHTQGLIKTEGVPYVLPRS